MKKIILISILLFALLEASPIKTRALHLVIRGGEDITKMEELVLYAKKYHFNTLILMLANGVALDSMPWLKNKKRVWTKKEFSSFLNFVREQRMDVVPEIKLLTHQEKLFKEHYPHLMLNKRTYNPNERKVYDIVFPILNEVIQMTKCSKFHIGHDEVVGYNKHIGKKWINKGERRLSPKEFLHSILIIHSYLKKQGIDTMIWGDMLISTKEFPKMLPKHLHGSENFNDIRNKLPKDIIISDWHYFDKQEEFPSYKRFYDENFTVYGSTWKSYKTTKNFTKYVSDLNISNAGMIATTWYKPTKNKNSKVKEIIKISGEAFWSAK